MLIRERARNQTKLSMLARQKHEGLSDLLGYLLLSDDSTILHKDGALSSHFRYQPPDVETLMDAELDAISETWLRAMGFLGDGWLLETNVISHVIGLEEVSISYPDPMSKCIAKERDEMVASGRYYQTEYFLSLTYLPPKKIEHSFWRFLFKRKQQEQDQKQAMADFQKQVSEFIGFLERAMPISRVQDGMLITFLHDCLTGNRQQRDAPYQGGFLDTYLVSDDFIGGLQPMMGEKHIIALALDELPPESYPSLLDSLSHLPCEYRWSSRFVCLDALTTQAYLKRHERNWSSKAIGLMGVIRESFGLPTKIDRDAQAMAHTLEDAQCDNSSGRLNFGFYNSTLILMHENLEALNTLSETIVHHIQKLNCRVRREKLNACESFLGSLPCHGGYNLRRNLVDTRFLSHALPMSGVYQGDEQCPCPLYPEHSKALMMTSTEGARPFYFNHFVGDVGHLAILGPTGSGKSTLVACMIAAHRQYAGSRVVVLDKDASLSSTIRGLGGQYFSLSKLDCPLSPLAKLTTPLQMDRAIHWLSDISELQNVEMTPERQRLLREGVERLSQEERQYQCLDYLTLQDPDLRSAIQVFNQGTRKILLNGTTSNLDKYDVMGFDITEALNRTDEQVLLLPIIKAILHQIEDCFADKRPTLLVLEEAWSYLAHPIFRKKLSDWFKTLRKANVSVIFISQDLSDIVDSGSASVTQNSCLTRIYLANSQAKEPGVQQYYEAFGLNSREIEVISRMIPKQDYYYASRLGRRRFQLDLGEKAKSLLCHSRTKEINT